MTSKRHSANDSTVTTSQQKSEPYIYIREALITKEQHRSRTEPGAIVPAGPEEFYEGKSIQGFVFRDTGVDRKLFEQAVERIRDIALNVKEKLEFVVPDEIEVELSFAIDTKGSIILLQASQETAVKITLKWTKDDVTKAAKDKKNPKSQ